MPLIPTNYDAACSIPGCDKIATGKLKHLSQAGWTTKVIIQGSIFAEDIGRYHPSYVTSPHCSLICPQCSIQGKYK